MPQDGLLNNTECKSQSCSKLLQLSNIKVNFNQSGCSQGWEFLHDEFTQSELNKRYTQHAHDNHHARNEIIAMLYREANHFGEGASHSAHVRAQTQLSKIFGMETLKIEAETRQTGGVMVVPMCQSLDEWAEMVAPAQKELMEDALNI